MILIILGEHQHYFFLLPSSVFASFVCLGKLEFRGGVSGGNAATCKGVSVVSDRGAVEKTEKKNTKTI